MPLVFISHTYDSLLLIINGFHHSKWLNEIKQSGFHRAILKILTRESIRAENRFS